VYPDSLKYLVNCMHHDQMIMGCCGETRIANKRQSWVTAIQVFEYFISHHQAKAFESVFGGVTCLPGCFSMYRIKAPKGGQGYWVPILANPDIVEHYSENVVDTLHKKNLLLLGEDRYLTTLMLKTFPKRKQVFVPQAVCKTTVPDKFRVLLSQRRRWINSTVHNLSELVFLEQLCGFCCFSMRFIVLIDLTSTVTQPVSVAYVSLPYISSIAILILSCFLNAARVPHLRGCLAQRSHSRSIIGHDRCHLWFTSSRLHPTTQMGHGGMDDILHPCTSAILLLAASLFFLAYGQL